MFPDSVQVDPSPTCPKYLPTTLIDGILPDLVLKSSDSVLFYVHSHLLNAASANEFGGVCRYAQQANANRSIIQVSSDNSQTLMIILDIIYHTPSAARDFSPPFPFSKIAEAIERLGSVYGVDLQAQLNLSNNTTTNQTLTHPILQALHAQATYSIQTALELYILAAKLHMEALAVAASTYLVGFHISDLTDEQAVAMGPHYLRRLMLLQMRREEALKRILLQPPYPHPLTPDCDVLDQKMLVRAWTICVASFAFDLRPDLPSVALENVLGPLAGHVSCELCKKAIREQVGKIVHEWEEVKTTI